ncbi:MAG: 1-deoxy-D-xylulose-5-phosphate reductoisomerase [Firmicutes bacterium]|nr:1-deoxy-D-xylulose-5-phosphate reductoisomerase [Bacillota bacterium]
MKRLVILGSTGSIGTQTLEIVENYPDLYKVEGIAAQSSWQLLARQAVKFGVKYAAIGDEKHLPALTEALAGTGIQILSGSAGVTELASIDADVAVVALVGISGLLPTLRAIESGKTIALANKETLVVGGELVMKAAADRGLPILPIDSEHSAIFQCLNGENIREAARILLTSSGGPFRKLPEEELETKTAADALRHPTWNMGKKVTIDSSTMMNKGFEVIEACWLFGVHPSKIKVLVHPQSVVHSMVEFIDGSVIAQMSKPDMRIPIQYALTYPGRLPAAYVKTDFAQIGTLTFEEPRLDVFRCLQYAFDAIAEGGTMPAVLNGANEVAVEMFLQDKIRFMDIPRLIHKAMSTHRLIKNPALEDLLEADRFAREAAAV